MKSYLTKFKSFQQKIVQMGAFQKLQNSIQTLIILWPVYPIHKNRKYTAKVGQDNVNIGVVNNAYVHVVLTNLCSIFSIFKVFWSGHDLFWSNVEQVLIVHGFCSGLILKKPNPYKLSILGYIWRATILLFSSSKYFYSW